MYAATNMSELYDRGMYRNKIEKRQETGMIKSQRKNGD